MEEVNHLGEAKRSNGKEDAWKERLITAKNFIVTTPSSEKGKGAVEPERKLKTGKVEEKTTRMTKKKTKILTSNTVEKKQQQMSRAERKGGM